jgi:hypothetical protein
VLHDAVTLQDRMANATSAFSSISSIKFTLTEYGGRQLFRLQV